MPPRTKPYLLKAPLRLGVAPNHKEYPFKAPVLGCSTVSEIDS